MGDEFLEAGSRRVDGGWELSEVSLEPGTQGRRRPRGLDGFPVRLRRLEREGERQRTGLDAGLCGARGLGRARRPYPGDESERHAVELEVASEGDAIVVGEQRS